MTDGLDRFAELKRLAAETCGAATDDARIELMAAVRLAFERQVEALAAGQRIDYTAFTKTVEMLDKYAPPPKIEAKLVIVRRNAPTSPATPTAVTPEASTPKPETTPSTAAPAAPAAPVTPMPTHLGVSASKFHDAVLPDGSYAPLRKLNGSPRAYGHHTAFGPGVLNERSEVVPDWSVFHGKAITE